MPPSWERVSWRAWNGQRCPTTPRRGNVDRGASSLMGVVACIGDWPLCWLRPRVGPGRDFLACPKRPATGARKQRPMASLTTDEGVALHLVDGGAPELAVRLAVKLGDALHLSSPVRSIRQSSAGIEVFSDRLTVDARRVIVATPPFLASRIRYDPRGANELRLSFSTIASDGTSRPE
jgi:hypothetical protein